MNKSVFFFFSILLMALQDELHLIIVFWFVERVGAEVVECACVIELPELEVSSYIRMSIELDS